MGRLLGSLAPELRTAWPAVQDSEFDRLDISRKFQSCSNQNHVENVPQPLQFNRLQMQQH